MWQIGTTNIDSTTTGSLYVGRNEVKKVYKGQLQVYPDFIPFPSATIYDWWVADVSGSTGLINGKTLVDAWPSSGNPLSTFTGANGFKFFYANAAGRSGNCYPDETETYWQNNGGAYTIAAGDLTSVNANLYNPARLEWRSQTTVFNRMQLLNTGSNQYEYSVETTTYTSPTSPAYTGSLGFMMNVVDNNRNAGSGSRETYIQSSTPDISQTYNFNLGFPGKSPYIRVATTANEPTNPLVNEVIILLTQPSTADIDAYRQYISAKYGVIA